MTASTDLRRAAWASALGSAAEYYDFALYSLYSALIFGDLFFPAASANAALLASFGAYFLGFAVRPVGGILFGALGDRIGRRAVLALTLLLMGVSSTAIGLLPTYTQVGLWAPALLVALRLLQGLGAGAEQAGAAVLMTEFAPPERRGLFAALPFMGIQLGTIIAPLVVYPLLPLMKADGGGWLWRVPFLLSAGLVLVGLWIRLSLKETPTFRRLEARRQIAERPLADLFAQSRRTVLAGIGLRVAENGGSSLFQVLAISYLVKVIGQPASVGALCLICAAATGAIVVPLAGWMSDRFGRIPVYRGFALLQLLLAVPAWWAFSLGSPAIAAVALSLALGAATWGMFGAQGALLPELFGAPRRYLGVAVAREVSAVLVGGTAPLIGAAIIAWAPGGLGSAQAAWMPLAAYTALLAIVTIATTATLREPRGRDLDDMADAPLRRSGRTDPAIEALP